MKKIFSIFFAFCFASSMLMISTSAATLLDLNATTIIADKANWTGTFLDPSAAGQTTFTADTINLGGKNIKSAGYIGKKYQNFRFDYKLKITWPEDGYDWGAIVTFRDQDTGIHVWENGRKETYGIFYNLDSNVDDMKKAGSISISKWNRPVTNNGDPENLGQTAAYKNVNLNGVQHVYNLMVEDVSNGVQIKLYMDGKLIINYTDKSAHQIKKTGGIMVLQNGPRGVIFSGVKPGEQPVLQGNSTGSTTTKAQTLTTKVPSKTNSDITTSGNSTTSTSDVSTNSTSSEISSTESTQQTSDLPDESSKPTGGSTSNDNTIAIIIGAVLLILGAGTTAAILIIKKKKV